MFLCATVFTFVPTAFAGRHVPAQGHSAKKNLSRDYFTTEEDNCLIQLVNEYGTQNWSFIASKMETRNARQCRERWKNYLAPEISNEPWTSEEDQMLLDKHKEFGNRWTEISIFFPGRSGVNVRNRFSLLERQEKKAQRQFSDSMNQLKAPAQKQNFAPSQPPALIQFSCVTNVSVNLISDQTTNQTFIQQPMTSIAQNLNVTTNLRSSANVTNTFISTSLVANQGLNQPQTSPPPVPDLFATTNSDNFDFRNRDYVFDFELDTLWWPYSD